MSIFTLTKWLFLYGARDTGDVVGDGDVGDGDVGDGDVGDGDVGHSYDDTPQIEKDFFVNSRMDIPRRGCDPGHHII